MVRLLLRMFYSSFITHFNFCNDLLVKKTQHGKQKEVKKQFAKLAVTIVSKTAVKKFKK